MSVTVIHPCYTFVQEIVLYCEKTGENETYITEGEVSDEKRRELPNKMYVTNPRFREDAPGSQWFKDPEQLDLALDRTMLEEYYLLTTQQGRNPQKYLNDCFLHKIELLPQKQIKPFLDNQLNLHLQKGGDDLGFFNYTEKLIKDHESPAYIAVESWIKSKSQDTEITPSMKQGTARQISMVLFFIVHSKRVILRNMNQRDKAKVLEFLTGIGMRNLEDTLSETENFKFFKSDSKNKSAYIIKDLEIVLELFKEVGFLTEMNATKKVIKVIKEIKISKK
jgi:hypothetical protein